MFTITQLLIICPLVFLAGFIDAIAGGGGLISLPAFMIAGFPVHSAIGTTKLASTMGTTIATYSYAKNKYISWKIVLFCAITALIGSNLGANLNLLIDDYYLKIIMLVVIPITAIWILKDKSLKTIEKEDIINYQTILKCMFCTFFIGIYDGFYGPGAGTFLLLAFASIGHLSLSHANGSAKAINLVTNISALIVYLINGQTIVLLGLIAGVFNIAGALCGSKLFIKKGGKSLKPVIIVVLIIFFIKVVYELLTAN